MGQRVPLEVALLLRVRHIPSVVKLLAWEEHPERFFLFLERPDPCKDLWEYIGIKGSLTEEEARDYMQQVSYLSHYFNIIIKFNLIEDPNESFY